MSLNCKNQPNLKNNKLYELMICSGSFFVDQTYSNRRVHGLVFSVFASQSVEVRFPCRVKAKDL